MADLKLWDVYVQTERERDEARARLEVADRANDVLKAQLAEAERLLSQFLWYGDVANKDLNDDTWKFLGFPPDPRLSGNGDERHG